MKRHLIGIGGVGMSALATALVRLGDEVTGADRNLKTKNIAFLESLGVKCFPDDGSGIDATTDEVIVSTAIEQDNPGLAQATQLGILVTHRAKALSRALANYKLVAVVGTCGKSTVTAMLGHVLAECGLDPMCVNGANVPGWEGAVRFGRGAYAVAEVDESDKSLVAFSPYAAIVTNASADHYSKEEMDEVFDAFVKNCTGPVIDGRKVQSLKSKVQGQKSKVQGPKSKVQGPKSKVQGPESKVQDAFDLGLSTLDSFVPMPGEHNLANARLAATMAMALGCKLDDIKRAFATFRGVERRLQRITPQTSQTLQTSQTSQTFPVVYDDYAHNPEKLRAMWTTLAEAHPAGICVVWRPHGYAPLRKMMDALAEMFNETIRPSDKLLLLPVYDAGGTTDRSVNSDALAAKIAEGKVVLVPDLDAAYKWIAAHYKDFAAFATCGARDPDLPKLAQKISELA